LRLRRRSGLFLSLGSAFCDGGCRFGGVATAVVLVDALGHWSMLLFPRLFLLSGHARWIQDKKPLDEILDDRIMYCTNMRQNRASSVLLSVALQSPLLLTSWRQERQLGATLGVVVQPQSVLGPLPGGLVVLGTWTAAA